MQMHIEDIFEDLEAQFESESESIQRGSFTASAKTVELQTTNLTPVELIAPIIGVDFVAGLDMVLPIWHLFPMRTIQKIIFHSEGDAELPKLRNFDLDFVGIIQTFQMPCAIKWRIKGTDDFVLSGQLHNATSNLLFIYTDSLKLPIAVPIQALNQLSIESVDNLNDKS